MKGIEKIKSLITMFSIIILVTSCTMPGEKIRIVEIEKEVGVIPVTEDETIVEDDNLTPENSESEHEEEILPEPESESVIIPDPMQEMPEDPKLTLVVYMAADNDLESYAIQNLKAMEHADFEKMNVLVLLDRSEGFDETNGNWTDTRLFELIHDDSDSNIIVSKRLSCFCPYISFQDDVQHLILFVLIVKRFSIFYNK